MVPNLRTPQPKTLPVGDYSLGYLTWRLGLNPRFWRAIVDMTSLGTQMPPRQLGTQGLHLPGLCGLVTRQLFKRLPPGKGLQQLLQR